MLWISLARPVFGGPEAGRTKTGWVAPFYYPYVQTHAIEGRIISLSFQIGVVYDDAFLLVLSQT